MKPIIITITDNWIKQNHPCREAIDDWWDKKERNPIKILKLLIKAKKYEWANWFIVRIMSSKDYISYAVFAAENVIDIYEKKYPADKRPREAIEAAKKCIDNPSEKNKAAANAAANAACAAAYAAAYAACAAACAAAYAAAYAAANAAYAAAYAAANAAANAAYAAANAANAAYAAANAAYAAYAAAYAANAAMRLKILKYGLRLLKKN